MITIDVEALAAAIAAKLEFGDGSPWMTTVEAAEYLRVSEKTLRRWIGDGLTHRRVDGGRLLFHRTELDEWLDGHKSQ